MSLTVKHQLGTYATNTEPYHPTELSIGGLWPDSGRPIPADIDVGDLVVCAFFMVETGHSNPYMLPIEDYYNFNPSNYLSIPGGIGGFTITDTQDNTWTVTAIAQIGGTQQIGVNWTYMGFGFSHIINPLTAGVDGITLHSDRKPTLNGPGLYFGGATLTGVTPSPPLGQAGSIYANNAVSSAMTGVSSWSTNMLQLPGSPYYTSPLSITTSVPVNKGDLVIACQGCSDSHWDWQRPIIPGAYTWQQPQETNMPVGPPGWTDLGHMRRYYANTSAGGGWTSGS